MPADEGRLADLVHYHQDGFKRTSDGWPAVQALTEAHHQPGNFVTFWALSGTQIVTAITMSTGMDPQVKLSALPIWRNCGRLPKRVALHRAEED